MKNSIKVLFICMLCLSLGACGSKAENTADSRETDNRDNTETKKEDTVKDEAVWEVGEAKAVTFTSSIGTPWVQIICPVTNTGTRNLYLSAGTMDLEDEDGNLVDSESLVSVFPDVLMPGETGYYYEETTLDEGAPMELTVLPHVKVREAKVEPIRLQTSEIAITDETYGGIKITGRVENTTDEDQSLVYVTAFLYDADDNMIASEFTILMDEIAAGDKMGFSMTSLSLPDDITAAAIDHYVIFAYPQQFQF